MIAPCRVHGIRSDRYVALALGPVCTHRTRGLRAEGGNVDATVVPLRRPQLYTALDDLDEINDQLESIQAGIKILVHDGRIDGSGFRDLHVTTALLEIGNVRHDLAQLSSLSEVDTSLAVDLANLVSGLRELVGELGAVAKRLSDA